MGLALLFTGVESPFSSTVTAASATADSIAQTARVSTGATGDANASAVGPGISGAPVLTAAAATANTVATTTTSSLSMQSGSATATTQTQSISVSLSPSSAVATSNSTVVSPLEGVVLSTSSAAATAASSAPTMKASYTLTTVSASATAAAVAALEGAAFGLTAGAATASALAPPMLFKTMPTPFAAIAVGTVPGKTVAYRSLPIAIATANAQAHTVKASFGVTPLTAYAQSAQPFGAWNMVTAYTEALRALAIARVSSDAQLAIAGAAADVFDVTTYKPVDAAQAQESYLSEAEAEISLALELATEYSAL